MANPVKGSVGEILFSFDAGSTYTALGGVTNVDFSFTTSDIAVTDFDSNNFVERLAGDKEAAFSVDANYEEGDAVQDDLLDEIIDSSTVRVRIRPQVGTGKRQFTFDVVLDSSNVTLPENDKSAFKISGKSNGAITISTQT